MLHQVVLLSGEPIITCTCYRAYVTGNLPSSRGEVVNEKQTCRGSGALAGSGGERLLASAEAGGMPVGSTRSLGRQRARAQGGVAPSW